MACLLTLSYSPDSSQFLQSEVFLVRLCSLEWGPMFGCKPVNRISPPRLIPRGSAAATSCGDVTLKVP